MSWGEQLTDDDLKMAAACRLAAAEMGITVKAPFTISAHGKVFQYAALIEKFGYGEALGTVYRVMPDTFHPEQTGEIWTVAGEAGFLACNICPVLTAYSWTAFVDHLDSLEWLGNPADRPPWHSGKYTP